MWAVDSVVARANRSRESMEGRIDLLDLTSDVTRTIHTGSYTPQQVAFAPDNTIWTAGYNAGNDEGRDFGTISMGNSASSRCMRTGWKERRFSRWRKFCRMSGV